MPSFLPARGSRNPSGAPPSTPPTHADCYPSGGITSRSTSPTDGPELTPGSGHIQPRSRVAGSPRRPFRRFRLVPAGHWGRFFRVGLAVLGCVPVLLWLAEPALAFGPMPAVKPLPEVIDSARNWLVGILFGLATFFLTLGAARLVIARGDPGEMDKGRQALKSAGYGYALALLAPVILEIIKGILGA